MTLAESNAKRVTELTEQRDALWQRLNAADKLNFRLGKALAEARALINKSRRPIVTDDFSDFPRFVPRFVPTEIPEWLYLLSQEQLTWRDAQLAKGRNPDHFIYLELANAGLWPPREAA